MAHDSTASMKTAGRSLASAIGRCPIMLSAVLDRSYSTACRRIVDYQSSHGLADHELPEPWSGHIETAPILFVSSNPSIGNGDDPKYPHASWSDNAIYGYFDDRFEHSIIGGIHPVDADDYWVRFWAGVKERAAELLGRSPCYGVDYALTEVVHCKSRDEVGVAEALDTCSNMWLMPVLALSGASVIVVLGSPARDALRKLLNTPDVFDTIWGPTHICGRQRLTAFLPHPNAREARTFVDCMPDELPRIRDFLTSSTNRKSPRDLLDGPDGMDDRYLRMLTEETTRACVETLARLKAMYHARITNADYDANLARALRDGAQAIRRARGKPDLAAERFVRAYMPWLYNQECWERGLRGNQPEPRYLQNCAAAIDDFDRRHGYTFFR